jgi:hypothetical protein
VGTRRAGAALLAALAAVFGVAIARAAPPNEAVAKAGKYLVARQTADGAWMSPSAPADQVADGVVGLVSAAVTDAPLTKALKYVADHGPTDANRASATARVVLAAVAGGRNPRDFGTVDYVGRLRTYYNPTTGNYDPATDANALAILGLIAATERVPEQAVTSLQARQCDNGGFARNTCLLGSDTATTALALDALIAIGVGADDPAQARARSYLLSVQNADGGFGTAAGQPTAALPTGFVLGAIAAMAEDPHAAPWRKSATADPIAALVALQDPSGGVRPDGAATSPDDMTTARVLPGLAGRAFPVRPSTAETQPSATTAPAGAAPGASTSVPPSATTVAQRGQPRPTPTVATPPASAKAPEVGLAAPAGRAGNGGGRSLVGLAPFIVTLFGAGAVGLVLRRRARI